MIWGYPYFRKLPVKSLNNHNSHIVVDIMIQRIHFYTYARPLTLEALRENSPTNTEIVFIGQSCSKNRFNMV